MLHDNLNKFEKQNLFISKKIYIFIKDLLCCFILTSFQLSELGIIFFISKFRKTQKNWGNFPMSRKLISYIQTLTHLSLCQTSIYNRIN